MTIELTAAAATRAFGIAASADQDPHALLERYAAVVWSHLVEPGDSGAGRLIAAHGCRDALEVVIGRTSTEALSAKELHEARRRWMPRLNADQVAHSLRTAAHNGVSIVTPADPDWPSQLDDLGPHAPRCLWVRGDTGLLGRLRPSVAVVGARAATSYGDHVAMELAADLAGGGIPVVSGGAYGIDGAAHRASLEVGGVTVAMLAGGVERAYPAGHSSLIDRVIATGAVTSEVPCGSAPTKWRFLQRNRLIAAITDATVVVEAGWRSGSLNTAGHAASLGRHLGAVPGPITSATSAGTHKLLRDYGATCITNAADVRELLGYEPHALLVTDGRASTGPRQENDGRPATDDTMRVRDALSTRSPRESADVARRAGMPVDAVEAILGLLQLDGTAVCAHDGWRMATTR